MAITYTRIADSAATGYWYSWGWDSPSSTYQGMPTAGWQKGAAYRKFAGYTAVGTQGYYMNAVQIVMPTSTEPLSICGQLRCTAVSGTSAPTSTVVYWKVLAKAPDSTVTYKYICNATPLASGTCSMSGMSAYNSTTYKLCSFVTPPLPAAAANYYIYFYGGYPPGATSSTASAGIPSSTNCTATGYQAYFFTAPAYKLTYALDSSSTGTATLSWTNSLGYSVQTANGTQKSANFSASASSNADWYPRTAGLINSISGNSAYGYALADSVISVAATCNSGYHFIKQNYNGTDTAKSGTTYSATTTMSAARTLYLFTERDSGIFPYIYISGVWKEVIPYVYTNGAWKECKADLYLSSAWK